MTIQEIETRTGLSRANIRFYEQEGLLCPTRRPNGYREYSEQDLKMLLRIRLLRAIGLPIEQIRRLQDGTLRLEDALNDRCKWLHEQARSSAVAESLCNKLLQAGVSFDALDPTEYLVDLDADRPDLPVEDAAALRRLSLRRYFARMLDFGIYGLIWFALCALLFTRNLSTSPGGLVLLLDSAAGFALLFLFEPLLLHLFGSTPGKAALGLYVESSCGAKPGYWEALDRTGLVFSRGFGYGVPLYGQWRLWKCFQALCGGEALAWELEDRPKCFLRSRRWYRLPVYLLCWLLVFALLAVMICAQWLPPHRGPLTVEEFADNYRYYAKYLDVHFDGWTIGEDGVWQQEPGRMEGVGYLPVGFDGQPVYNYTVNENRELTRVDFEIEIQSGWVSLAACRAHIRLCALALAGAQPQNGMFSESPSQVFTAVEQAAFPDLSFQAGGIRADCETSWSGYERIEPLDLLVPLEGTAQRFLLRCTIYLSPGSE